MFARPLGRQSGQFAEAVGARPFLDQRGIGSNAAGASTTLTVANFSGGILNRTGPGAGFTDTWPDADSLIAAMDNPQKGDAFSFTYRNAVAFAMTFAAGVGIVSGIGTLNCAASSTKLYLLTLLSVKRTNIQTAITDGATGVLTGLSNAQIANVEQGMGATGTNIGASSIVLGVTPSDSPTGATITLSVNTTGAGTSAVTFFPRIQLDALGVMTN